MPMNPDYTVEEEFQIPDSVRDRLVDTIAAQGLNLVENLHAQGKPSEVLEDLLLDLHACSGDHRAFESWCHQDLPLALDSVRSDLQPTLWAWKQLVVSVREDPPFSPRASPSFPPGPARSHRRPPDGPDLPESARLLVWSLLTHPSVDGRVGHPEQLRSRPGAHDGLWGLLLHRSQPQTGTVPGDDHMAIRDDHGVFGDVGVEPGQLGQDDEPMSPILPGRTRQDGADVVVTSRILAGVGTRRRNAGGDVVDGGVVGAEDSVLSVGSPRFSASRGSSSLTRDRHCDEEEVPAQRAASSRPIPKKTGLSLHGSSSVRSEIKPPAGVPCLSGFPDIHTFRARILDDEIES